MILFVDFEASSLNAGSFPIEVGWVREDGSGETHLIIPQPGWTEWDPKSEAIHGISIERLHDEGKPAAWVGARMLEAVDPDKVTGISDATAFDQYWLGLLANATPGQRHPVLLELNTLLKQEVQPMMRHMPSYEISAFKLRDMAVHLVRQVEDDELARDRVRHRALPDAEGLRWRWMEVRRRVAEAVG